MGVNQNEITIFQLSKSSFRPSESDDDDDGEREKERNEFFFSSSGAHLNGSFKRE